VLIPHESPRRRPEQLAALPGGRKSLLQAPRSLRAGSAYLARSKVGRVEDPARRPRRAEGTVDAPPHGGRLQRDCPLRSVDLDGDERDPVDRHAGLQPVAQRGVVGGADGGSSGRWRTRRCHSRRRYERRLPRPRLPARDGGLAQYPGSCTWQRTSGLRRLVDAIRAGGQMEAAALAAYADIPVDLYTGVPEITLPAWDGCSTPVAWWPAARGGSRTSTTVGDSCSRPPRWATSGPGGLWAGRAGQLPPAR
jgi:hypothetical protein